MTGIQGMTVAEPARRRIERAAGWAALLGGWLVTLFWVLYLTGLANLGQNEPELASFEQAFPVADAVWAAILFTAGISLLNKRPAGAFCFVIAGSMSVYLGLLDLTFYARQGFYTSLTAEAVTQLFVTGGCIGGGTLGLGLGWRLWRTQ
ncbi:MAG: hypothetical protein ACE5PT_00220 [Gemmatimonadales bacterium]